MPKKQKPRGDSSMAKGIWVGKHEESDVHVFLTAAGWHRARTVPIAGGRPRQMLSDDSQMSMCTHALMY